MSLKLCFNNEIHRVSKLPVSISALTTFVQTIYGNALPSNWGLQYVDSEGDRIVLKSDEDLKILLGELKSGHTTKIFVTDSGIFDSKVSENDESYHVIQKEDIVQVENVIQEKIIPQVSNTNGDKTEVKQPENKEKPWEKYKNAPKYKANRIAKKLREEGLSEAEKLKNEEALAKIKETLNEEDLAWLEKKAQPKDKKERKFRPHRGEKSEKKEKREKSEKTEKGEKSERRHHHHKREGPFADAKKLLKQITFDKDLPEAELAESQKKYDEIFATLPENEKAKLGEKKAHYEIKLQKQASKKDKIATAFTKFLKQNVKDLISVTGHQKERCGGMKKLVEELCQAFSALPEEKQAEVGALLQGVPQKMMEMTKAKLEKKEKKKLEKENKVVVVEETAHPKEEVKSQEPEPSEKKDKKEKREKSEKKDKKEKKSKTPEKKADEKKAEEGTTSGSDQEVPKKVRPMIKTKVQIMKELFPEADAKVLREFVTKQVRFSIEELIDQYLAIRK